MKRVFQAPSKLVIGSGALREIGKEISVYGPNALLLAHPEDSARVQNTLDESCAEHAVNLHNAGFRGECCYAEVERTAAMLQEKSITCVVGLGGGKAIDTAKILADKNALPCFSVPTIVSTDAPCSSLAVVYDEAHNYVENYAMGRGPALVLIDSKIVAAAPARFFAAGIGDAYATCYEAEMCAKMGGKNYGGGSATLSALALARLCRETLLANAPAAMQALRQHLVTPALENIIEANALMSGIGFESVGLSAAHCMDTILFILGARGALHGEQVAFGVLVQLVLENRPLAEIETTLRLYRQVGLPLCLKELGLEKEKIGDEAWKAALEFAKAPYSTMRHMPVELDEDLLKSALFMADSLHTMV